MYQLILQNVARHIQLLPAEAALFTSLLQARTVRRKELVVRAGEVCRYEYFVNRGCLRAFYTDHRGQEHTAQFAVEDWWIGDLQSFVRHTPALYQIEALEDSELLVLDRPALEQLYQQVPAFERYFRLLIQNAFIAQQQRTISALSLTALERYQEFVHRYPTLEQRVPQYLVASYLGLTPESLSRVRRQYQQARRG